MKRLNNSNEKQYVCVDDVIDALYENEFATHCPLDEVSDVIYNVTVANVKEIKQGHWKVIKRPYPMSTKYQCSVCGEILSQPYKHCPECTALCSTRFHNEEPIENRIMEVYGVDAYEYNEEEFVEHFCHNCGSQRCEGVGTEWFEGCQYKEHLKDYEKFYGESEE